MRLVSAMVLRTSASCSSVVIPGLSERKSLPRFMARTAIPARSLAICEVSTSCTAGIVENLVLRLHDLHVGKSLAERRDLVFFAAPRRHQFAAAALHSADHPVDVVVAHAADGKLDVILRRFFGLAQAPLHLQLRAPRCHRVPWRSPAVQPSWPQSPATRTIPPASKIRDAE